MLTVVSKQILIKMFDHKKWLMAREYDKNLVEYQIYRATLLNRDELLSGCSTRDKLRVRDCFVIIFHPSLSRKIYNVLETAQIIFQCIEDHPRSQGFLHTDWVE